MRLHAWQVALAVMLPAGGFAAQDFSPAEQAIFMADQLANLRPPSTLRYSFHKAGSLEAGFDDTVVLAFRRQPDGSCCTSTGEFLTGPRRLPLPDIDNAKANPVILYFLEHDIREMRRLTQGPENYFRKRIRMAVYQGATVAPASFVYQGKPVAGREVSFRPYLDDPNRYRYEKLAGKEYRFLLSDAVPGGVLGIRTHVAAAAGAEAGTPPLLTEDLLIDGADPLPRTPP
ncbi:hypothetical protein ASE08_20980 [Rhizobacter sp. Root16D2]|nr:hypothetical protein ASC88_22850 [Rhizobacter sp. Root29]KQW12717.1 hypothetical protein ASC98_19230 [Rhizobacter sp. Root1238]KRB22305.1 hypothetical protein ASE08_20980 [Rhizobacter sp. Root16D2]